LRLFESKDLWNVCFLPFVSSSLCVVVMSRSFFWRGALRGVKRDGVRERDSFIKGVLFSHKTLETSTKTIKGVIELVEVC
jgi:hypothetical protein